ncbi:family 78 glycoside hydrolase catalytic domain [Nocardia pseudovaccinii]|uniref:family 78 glycoside hydrolase catalytic domain n=1 Tax=Nocardia pseudovaccinii TaxID=189540 RepID=UPI003D8DF321
MPSDLVVDYLTVEYQSNPMPLDVDRPRFGWQIVSAVRGVRQAAYELRVGTSPDPQKDADPVWTSGRVDSDSSIGIVYAGPDLAPRTRYYWTVRVWAGGDESSTWADPAWWETGLRLADWQARWIEPVQRPAQPEPSVREIIGTGADMLSGAARHDMLNPPQQMRKTFTARAGLTDARLYASAHGIYTAEINGARVGDLELAPETTAYPDFLMYQAYDVTDLIVAGDNAIGFIVADGWWAGRLGMFGTSVSYGDRLALIAQLELRYADGSLEVVATDGSFRSSTGAIRYADLLIGEKHDARLDQIGWTTADFDDISWTSVTVTDTALDKLRAQVGEPVRAVCELPCLATHPTSDQGQIVDFGQVIAGRIRVDFADLPAGTEVRIQHCSVLGPNGDYFDSINGRNNENTDVYIARGGRETFEPRLTYHPFRYVKITGHPGPVAPAAIHAVAISSDLVSDFTFHTSDHRIEQLHSSVLWTLRDNSVSIPTDNPDRERAGWTGDLAVTVATSALYFGINGFMTRYLANLRIEQFDDGTVPMVIPFFKGYRELTSDILHASSSPAWGDVAVIAPWEVYQAYGDQRLLEQSYESGRMFHEYARRTAAGTVTEADRADDDLAAIWRASTFLFGDWLAPSTTEIVDGFYNGFAGPGANELIPTLYYLHSTDILVDLARVLGRTEDETRYRDIAAQVRRGFRKAFIDSDGWLTADTQSSYVLALAFRAAPELDDRFADRLRALIEANNGLLDTGFLATAFLLPVLSEHGLNDLAYSILLTDRYPSWLYMLGHGATTIWEMWRGVEADGTPNRASYAQPGLSTVGLWLGRYAAGIRPLEPGYRRILIHPRPGTGLDWVDGRYRSVRGEITVRWERRDTDLLVAVRIPPNTTASVVLDGARLDEILLDGALLTGHRDVGAAAQDGDRVCVEIGSGAYDFRYPMHHLTSRDPGTGS